jgi:hypothetical protein
MKNKSVKGRVSALEINKRKNHKLIYIYIYIYMSRLNRCFLTFVRPRPGKFFFHKTRAGPVSNKFTRKYISNFFCRFIHETNISSNN